MKEANDLRLQVASENTLSATDRQSKTFNNGPEGRQLIMPHNERPAEPLFCLDLSRLWADVCTNSYVDSMCFWDFQVSTPCTRYVFYVGIQRLNILHT